MFWHSHVDRAAEDVQRFGQAGIHLYTFGASIGEAWADAACAFASFDRAMELVLKADPQALVMPRLFLDPPDWWKQQHPDEVSVHLDWRNGDQFRDRVSPSSRIWRHDLVAPVAAFTSHCERRWGDRIVAYHPCHGDCGEFAYSWKTVVSDLSPAQTTAFRAYLRDRYPTDEALQAAWNDPTATLDAVQVPNHRDRTRAPGQSPLLDAAREQRVIDYLRFHSRSMADAAAYAAKVVKEALESLGRQKVVGVFANYVFFGPDYPHARHNSGHGDHEPLLESPHVDFIAAPESYQERHSGGHFWSQLLPASTRLHGKLFWSEDDTFTHRAKFTPWRYCCRDAADTAHVLWRNTAGALAAGGTKWFMDHDGDGWYRDDALMAEVSQMRQMTDELLGQPYDSRAEIAVVVDETSLAFQRHDAHLSDAVLSRQGSELASLGAPVDLYRWRDLPKLAATRLLRRYRMWIFLSCFGEARGPEAEVIRQLQQDDRTLVWVAPSGIVGEGCIDAAATSKLVGIHVQNNGGVGPVLVETWVNGERIVYGTEREIGPVQRAADNAVTVHGWQLGRGEAGLVSRNVGKSTVWWSSAPALPGPLLRHIARSAGVHLYTESGEQVLVLQDRLLLHGKSDGQRSVHLPPAADGRRAIVQVEVKRGETRSLALSGSEPATPQDKEEPQGRSAVSSPNRRQFMAGCAAAAAAAVIASGPGRRVSGAAAPEDSIAARKQAFLRFWGITVTPNDGIGTRNHPAVTGMGANSWNNLFYLIPQLELANRDPASVHELSGVAKYISPGSIRFINDLRDCSDFVMHAALRMLYLYPDSKILGEARLAELKTTVLNFVYWNDEPTPHKGVMFTENHQMLFSSAEYLAGQLYPDEIFHRVHQPGRWRMARGRERVLRWLDWRIRFGFSEWRSAHYYDEDFVALFNLQQLAKDKEVVEKVEHVLSLMLFEMAVNSQGPGVFNGTQGRVYSMAVLRPQLSLTSAITHLCWNKGWPDRAFSMSAVCLATSPYEPPPVLAQVAQDSPRELENLQRCSATYEDLIDYGIKPNDALNYPLFSSTGTWKDPRYCEEAAAVLPEQSAQYKEVQSRLRVLKKSGSGGDDCDPWALPRVNLYTFRTPQFMLSCAQDWRRGERGYQQHVWTAVLDEEAQVFTTNPHVDKSRVDEWAGNGSLPKAVAYRNVLLCLYRIPDTRWTAARTHAWFPRFAFDEVHDQDGWVLGRRGDGFVGLRSIRPAKWIDPSPEFFTRYRYQGRTTAPIAAAKGPVEYSADGSSNVWICELGNASLHGSFREFASKLTAARVEGDETKIIFDSPSCGRVETGWDLPLTIKGQAVDLHPAVRFSNPYCTAAFAERRQVIRHKGQVLELG